MCNLVFMLLTYFARHPALLGFQGSNWPALLSAQGRTNLALFIDSK